MTKKAAVAIDAWKLPVFKKHLDDGMNTLICDWNDERYKMPAGTKIYARRELPPLPKKEG